MAYDLIKTTVNLYQPAIIKTEGVAELKNEIEQLSKEMKEVEVTEENLQKYKKLLAQVRSKWSEVDRQRIDVKKEVLKPYNELDAELKEIKQILTEGESHIQQQITKLANEERAERYKELRKLFDKQHSAYKAPNWLTFEKFCVGRESLYNNKSTSNRKKVTEITSFFEKYNEDYQQLKQEFEFEDDRTAILLSYSTNGYNMPLAVESYKAMIAEKERLHELQKQQKQKPKISLGTKPNKVKKDKKVYIEVSEKDLQALDKYGIIYRVVKK